METQWGGGSLHAAIGPVPNVQNAEGQKEELCGPLLIFCIIFFNIASSWDNILGLLDSVMFEVSILFEIGI